MIAWYSISINQISFVGKPTKRELKELRHKQKLLKKNEIWEILFKKS